MTTIDPAAHIANHFDLTEPYGLFNALRISFMVPAVLELSVCFSILNGLHRYLT